MSQRLVDHVSATDDITILHLFYQHVAMKAYKLAGEGLVIYFLWVFRLTAYLRGLGEKFLV